MTLKFAMNRTCAPDLSLDDFLALAQRVGVAAVEIRNDIDSREFADGTPAAELRGKIEAAGLAIASVNALQRFNDWTAERDVEAQSIVAYAADLGAPGVVLCPVHTPEDWDPARAMARLVKGLRQLAPILRDHGVLGYVEPLGMPYSTMKRQDMAVAAIEAAGGLDCYQLCYDTFQYFRCGDDRLFPQHIGLAHISGISRPDLAPGALTEPDRGLIFPDDRVGNVRQLKALNATGYQGFVSMEPFSPEVQRDPDLAVRLRASLEYLGALVGIGLDAARA